MAIACATLTPQGGLQVPFRHHRTVDRVVAICEAVARDGRGLTLGDLADRLQAPKSSIQELTNGLLATGYLVEEQKKFFLGPAPFVLTLMSNPVAARAIEHDDLIRLSKKMGTTVLIASHDTDLVSRAGKPVLHLEDGRLAPYPGYLPDDDHDE